MELLSKVKNIAYERLWNIRNRSYPTPTSEQIGDKNIKVFVITHNDKDLPHVFDNRDVYVPLRVGNAIKPTVRNDWLVDDAGENISSYNALLNEMTGIWWVANHFREVGNPDYVGFMHYRRFLQWSPRLLKPRCLISTSGTSIHQLATLDKALPLDVFRAEFAKKFSSDDLSIYDAYWRSHTLYYANLFITDKDTFAEYFSFLSHCLDFIFEMIHSNAIDLSNGSSFPKRLYGYYLERITSFYIYYAKQAGQITNINTEMDFLG